LKRENIILLVVLGMICVGVVIWRVGFHTPQPGGTVSPTLYHLPLMRTSSPKMPWHCLGGFGLGGGGTNMFFSFRDSTSFVVLSDKSEQGSLLFESEIFPF